MENQRGVEELLADVLRRQDQHTELLAKLVEGQNALVKGQNALVEGQKCYGQGYKIVENSEYNFRLIVDELKALREDMKRMDEFDRRLKAVESKVLPR